MRKLEISILILLIAAFHVWTVYPRGLPVFMGEFNTLDLSIYVARFVDFIFFLTIFFIVGFHLIPKYLDRKKMPTFLFLSIGLVGIISFVEYKLDFEILKLFNLPTGPNMISDKMLEHPHRKTIAFPALPVNLSVYTLGLLYGLSRDWIVKSRRHQEIQQEKMKADIAFLRSQINPHFFFNALNNIFAITQRNHDNEAGQAIMKLSDLMRYIIYDSCIEKIRLDSEIQFIRNYIEIFKLKFAKEENVDISLKIDGSPKHVKLAPLLLVPFIENACKHGITSKGEGYVDCTIRIKAKQLEVEITNSICEKSDTLNKHSGIGLDNVKKRLHMLYPENHYLSITADDECYQVHLKLELNKDDHSFS